MNKLIFLVSLLILSTISVIAQKWEVKNYLDDFGDPSGKKYIIQTVEGTYGNYPPMKIKVVTKRELGSSDNFYIYVYWGDRVSNLYPNGTPIKINEIYSTIHFGEVLEYFLRYKTDKKESWLNVLNPIHFGNDFPSINMQSYTAVSFEIKYSELNAILLSTSLPIKCIIAEKGKDSFVNIIRFTLYPSNYKR